MFKDRMVVDLCWVTAAKIAVVMLIYWACFAAYDGRKVDAVTHFLGPVSMTKMNSAGGS